MLFRMMTKRDGSREVKIIEDWPDEDKISRAALDNEDMYLLDEGQVRVVVANGTALYAITQEDADYLWLRKVSSSLDKT